MVAELAAAAGLATAADPAREAQHWRQEAERLRASRDRLIDFMSTASDWLYETDADGRFISGKVATGGRRSSPGFALLDSELASAFSGKTIFEVVGDNPAMREALEALRADKEARKPFRCLEFCVTLSNGKAFWMESGGNPYFGADGRFLGYRGTTRNITRRKEDEALIAFMVRHDALTKLGNRFLLREKIDEALRDLEPNGGLAVLFLDLDRFKMVNDTLGHAAGDTLLRLVAARLSSCVSSMDTVARLGGDEFAVVKRHVGRPEDAIDTARRIVEALGQPCEIDGRQVAIGSSIGIALAPADGQSPEVLFNRADIALYRAKIGGAGGWRFFEPEMAARIEARRGLENDLRAAMARDQFEIFYQPLYNLESREIASFEALLRWRRPGHGLAEAGEFIALAEDTGLIVPIGEWVLGQACAEAAKWPENIGVAVNLSPVQLRSPRLVREVGDALRESGLAGGRLELEITEGALTQYAESAVAALNQFREMGARIAMDHFGTGYSSLTYLRSFAFDKVKIDRSFIRDLPDPRAAATVRAIAGIGSSLSLPTTAEGVETPEQLKALRGEGCTEAQGHLFGQPLPAREVAELLRSKCARFPC